MMKNSVVLLLCLSAGLAACQNDTSPAQQTAPDAPAVVADPIAVESNASGALPSVSSLTEKQLLDASIIDTAGMEIGDVEGIVRDANGKIEKLLVEVEGSAPDKFVHLGVEQVTPVQDKDDWDLRAPLTREDLMAMPSVTR